MSIGPAWIIFLLIIGVAGTLSKTALNQFTHRLNYSKMFLDEIFDCAKKIAGKLLPKVKAIQNAAQSAQATTIAAQFPVGSAVDQAAIKIATDATNVIASIDTKLPGAQSAVDAIYNKLHTDLTQLYHGSTRHGFGFYLRAVAVVIEDVAEEL